MAKKTLDYILCLGLILLAGCTTTADQTEEPAAVWENTLDAVGEVGAYRIVKSGVHEIDERDLNISYQIEFSPEEGYYRKTCWINGYNFYEILVVGGKTHDRKGMENWTNATAPALGKEALMKELLGTDKEAAVTLLGSENMEGEECWVLKVIPKDAEISEKEITLWVSKNDSLPRKRVENIATILGEGSWSIRIEYPLNLTV
ncbi:MAG: outer membrane lipoprotein-sorting protein, partial [Euryarchaeota archaeon]|nr:outer membrane lipoprotein-sorting protein [Euryarchaeota archaeon]